MPQESRLSFLEPLAPPTSNSFFSASRSFFRASRSWQDNAGKGIETQTLVSTARTFSVSPTYFTSSCIFFPQSAGLSQKCGKSGSVGGWGVLYFRATSPHHQYDPVYRILHIDTIVKLGVKYSTSRAL